MSLETKHVSHKCKHVRCNFLFTAIPFEIKFCVMQINVCVSLLRQGIKIGKKLIIIAVWTKERNLRNSEIDSELLYMTLIE